MSLRARAKSKPQVFIGLLALLVPYGIGVILLSSYPSSGDLGYAAITFFSILGISLTLSRWALQYTDLVPWFDSPDRKDWIYFIMFPIRNKDGKMIFALPFGYPALLLMAYLVTPLLPGSYGILLAIAGSGLILYYQIIKTKTVFVNWMTHFAYNMTAVVLAYFAIVPLGVSPIFVPNLSIDGATSLVLGKQATMQLIGVTLSEEMMKVSIMSGMALLGSRSMTANGGIAAFLWTILHTILSYKISLPF